MTSEAPADVTGRDVPPELILDFDVFAEGTIEDQHERFVARRELDSMRYTNRHGGYWVATSYDDIADVLRNHDAFINFPSAIDGVGSSGQSSKLIPIELDGPEHRAYRQLLNPLFSPAMAAELEPDIRRFANELIDAFIESGKCEFVQDFARPLPGIIFLRMMDWPIEDFRLFQSWVDVMLNGVPGASAEDSLAAKVKAGTEAHQYIAALVEERRLNPGTDLTSQLLAADLRGGPIPDDQLRDMFLLLLMAGLDTVQSVLSQSMAFLATNEEFRGYVTDPDRVGDAVEELIRWAAPANPTRTAVAEVEVGGICLKPGDRVHCPLPAANRDPAYYPDPDVPRLDRPVTKPHLTFSVGAHRCLGSHIARLEVRAALEEWHRRIPTYRVGEGGVSGSHLGHVWGIHHIPLEF